MSRLTKKFILTGLLSAVIACCLTGIFIFTGEKSAATAAFVPDLDGYTSGYGYVKPKIYTMTEIEQMVFSGGTNFAPPASINDLDSSGNDLPGGKAIRDSYKIMVTDAKELYTLSYLMDGRPAESYGSLDFRVDIARFFLNKNYILGDFIDYASIDADKEAAQKLKQGFMPFGFASYPFTGTFDGQGFTVKNIYFEEAANRVTTTAYLGFFAHNMGFVKDIGIIYETERNTNVTNLSSKILVGFAGVNEAGGVIDHCYVQATAGGGLVGGAEVSGFVYENRGTINGGYFAGRVAGTSAQPLLVSQTGAGSNVDLFYNSSLHTGGTAFGSGMTTANMQQVSTTMTYPGWYVPRDWGETKYPQRCGLIKIGATTGFKIMQPSDLVYLQFLPAGTIGLNGANAGNIIYLARSLDMTYVSDNAVKTNLVTYLAVVFTSLIDPADPIQRVNATNNCIINLRIHQPVKEGTNFHYGLVRLYPRGEISNIDFIGGSVYINLGAEIQSSNLFAGLVVSQYYVSGSANIGAKIINVNASHNVTFEEEVKSASAKKEYTYTGATAYIGGIIGYSAFANNISPFILSNITYSGNVYGGTHIGYNTTTSYASIGGIFGQLTSTNADTLILLENCRVRGTVTGVKFAKRQLTGSTIFQSNVGSIGGYLNAINVELNGISSTATVNCYPSDPLGYKNGNAGYYNIDYSSNDIYSRDCLNASGGLFGQLGGTNINSSGNNGLSFTGGTLNLYEDYGYIKADGADSEIVTATYPRMFYAGGLIGYGTVSGTSSSIKNLVDCYGTINYVNGGKYTDGGVQKLKTYSRVIVNIGIISGGIQTFSNCVVTQTLEINTLNTYRVYLSGISQGGNIINCRSAATIKMNSGLDLWDNFYTVPNAANYLYVLGGISSNTANAAVANITNSISEANLEYGSDNYETRIDYGRVHMGGAGYNTGVIDGFESNCTMTLKNVVMTPTAADRAQISASGCATNQIQGSAANIVNKTNIDFSNLVFNSTFASALYISGIAYSYSDANSNSTVLSDSANRGNFRFVSDSNELRLNTYIGGFGYTVSGPKTITECVNTGDITVGGSYLSGTIYLGGICAFVSNNTVNLTNVYNKGNISFNNTGAAITPYLGGIIGRGTVPTSNALNEGAISCASSAINSSGYVGGIFGQPYTAADQEFVNLINRGNINVSLPSSGGTIYAGGIAGQVYSAAANRIFYDLVNSGNITISGGSGTLYAGGIFGNIVNASAGLYVVYSAINYGSIQNTATSTAKYLGGFTGYENAYINGAVIGEFVLDGFANYGNISGGQYIGGVAGQLRSGDYRNIVNYGALSGTSAGAFSGRQVADASSVPRSITNFIHVQNASGNTLTALIATKSAVTVGYPVLTDVYSTTTANFTDNPVELKTNSANAGGIYHEDFKLRLEGNLASRLVFSVHGYNGYKAGANLLDSGVGSGKYIYAVVSSNQYRSINDNRRFGYYLTDGMEGMLNGISDSALPAAERTAVSGVIFGLRQLLGIYETEIINLSLDVTYGDIHYETVEPDALTSIYQGDPHMPTVSKFIREPNDIRVYLDAEKIQTNFGNADPYYFGIAPGSFMRTYHSGYEYRDATNTQVVGQLSFEIENLNLQQVDVLIGYIRVYQMLPDGSGYGNQYKDWAVYVSYIPEIKGLGIQSIIYDNDADNQEQLPEYTTVRDPDDFALPTATPTASVVNANTVVKSSTTDDYNSSMDWRAGRVRINLFTYGLSTGISYRDSLRVYKTNDFSMLNTAGAIDMSGYTEILFSDSDRVDPTKNKLFYTDAVNNGIIHNVSLVTEGDTVYTRGTLFFELEFNDRLEGGCYVIQVMDSEGIFTLTVGVIKIFADEFNYLRYGGVSAVDYAMYYYHTANAQNIGLTSNTAGAYTIINDTNTLAFSMRCRDYPQLDLLATGDSFSSLIKQAVWFTIDAKVLKAYKIDISVVDTEVEFYPSEAEISGDLSVIQKIKRTVSTHVITVYFRTEYGRQGANASKTEEWKAVFTENLPITTLFTISQAGIAFDKVDEIRAIKVQRAAANGNGNIVTTYTAASYDYYTVGDVAFESYKDGEPIYANGVDYMPNALMTSTRVMALTFVMDTIGGYYGFHPFVRDAGIVLNANFSSAGIDIGILDAQNRGAAVLGNGSLEIIGMKYYFTPIFVEKTVNNDSYIKNVFFESSPKPATAELYKIVAEGTPSGRVDINDGQVIYTGVNTDYKDLNRDKDLVIYARYSSDEATLSSYVSFAIPELSTLYELQYIGDQWIWQKIYWSEALEDGTIVYYGNPRVSVYEGSNVKFKCVAENTNFETEYSVTLATMIPVQYIDVIINVPANYNGQAFASLYTMIESNGAFSITRATNIIYSKAAAVPVTIEGKTYMSHTVNLAKHILTYFQIAVTTIQGYGYQVKTDDLVDPAAYSNALKAASNGRPIIYLSQFDPAARIIEITITDEPFDSWGYYYNSPANPWTP